MRHSCNVNALTPKCKIKCSHFLFSNNLKQFSLSTAQNTLEDVRVISLEGQIAFQKIELEKLKDKIKEQRLNLGLVEITNMNMPVRHFQK